MILLFLHRYSTYVQNLKSIKDEIQVTSERVDVRLQLIGETKERQEESIFYKGQRKVALNLLAEVDSLLQGTDEVKEAARIKFPHSSKGKGKGKRSTAKNDSKATKRARLDAESAVLRRRQQYKQFWKSKCAVEIENKSSNPSSESEDDQEQLFNDEAYAGGYLSDEPEDQGKKCSKENDDATLEEMGHRIEAGVGSNTLQSDLQMSDSSSGLSSSESSSSNSSSSSSDSDSDEN